MKRFRMQVTIVTRDDSLVADDMKDALMTLIGDSDEVCSEEAVVHIEAPTKASNDFADTNWNSLPTPESERDSHVDAWYEAAKLFAEGD